MIPRWRSKKSTRESSLEASLNFMLPYSSTGSNAKLEIETWLIDCSSNQSIEVLPSTEWLLAKMKTTRKAQDVWSRFAKLGPHWRNRIFAFLDHRRRESPDWTLYHLEIPQKWSRTRLFSQRHDEQLIQLILCRRKVNDEDNEMPSGTPKSEGSGNTLPKRVSFAEKPDDHDKKREVNAASDPVQPRNTSDLRERIARLEEKRDSVGVHEQERIGDLNDMIAYLRDQLRLDAAHSSNLDTMAPHDEDETEPMRSESNRPQIIYEERIIESPSRRDEFDYSHNKYDSGRPSNAPRISGHADDIPFESLPHAARHPSARQHNYEATERESRPGKIDYEGRHGLSNGSRYWARERRMSHDEEEDNIGTYHNHDRPSQRAWRERPRERVYYEEDINFRRREREPMDNEIIIKRDERSRSRSRPSRQDSAGIRDDFGIIETSWERPRSRPSRPSRQPSREIDYDDYFLSQKERDDDARRRETMRAMEEGLILDRGEVARDKHIRDMERTRDRKILERQAIMNLRNVRPRSRLRERQNLSNPGHEDFYRDSRVRRERLNPDDSGQSQALVLRAGASGLPYDYIRDRVLNAGIRVRGEDDIGSPRPGSVRSQHNRRSSRPSASRTNSHRDRTRVPLIRRRSSGPWHQFDSSEDDEYRYSGAKRVDSAKKDSETELSDAEVIAQTLKQLTTIQDSDIPATGIGLPPFPQERTSEAEVGPGAVKNTPSALPGPERKKSFPLPGRKAHFSQTNGSPQSDQEGHGVATNRELKAVDEGPFLDKISEEPDVMAEDNDIPHHQRVVYFPERPFLDRPQQGSSFPSPPDLVHLPREASPRPQSRDSNLESPRSRPANGPIILEHGGYTLASQAETAYHPARGEGYDEDEITRQISRNPTIQELDDD